MSVELPLSPSMWTALAILLVAALALPLTALLRRRRAGRTPGAAERWPWMVAAASAGTMLYGIARQVSELPPRVTAIDVVALAVTGVLTGLFLGLAVGRSRSNAPG